MNVVNIKSSSSPDPDRKDAINKKKSGIGFTLYMIRLIE